MYHISEMRIEASAGGFGERRDKAQVIRSRGDRDVAHVDGEFGQQHLDIGAFAIPAQQHLNRKKMAIIPYAELAA